MAGIAESETTNTQSVLLKNIIDRNTSVWWALILAKPFQRSSRVCHSRST
jgi:hypothetical protein